MESLRSRSFASWEEAQEACDALARAQGFALVVATKKPSAAAPSYVYLRCSKGRKYVDRGGQQAADRRRRSSSQMTQCPFRLVVKLHELRRAWSVSFPAGHAHNHPFVEPMAHAKYKREAIAKYASEIVGLHKDGLRPGLITAQLRSRSLQEDPNVQAITPKQVRNMLAKHRQEELATPIRFLHDKPDESEGR